MQPIKRDVSLAGTAVMFCNCRPGTRAQRNIVMMGYFEKHPRGDVRREHEESDPPSSHLCPYPER